MTFEDDPILSTKYTGLYLRDNGKLSTSPQKNESSVSHVADSYQTISSEFTLIFDQSTTMVGHSKAGSFVSSNKSDDMHAYVSIGNLSVKGEVLDHVDASWQALTRTWTLNMTF